MDPKSTGSLEKFQTQGLVETLERTVYLILSTRNTALLINNLLSYGTQAMSSNSGSNRKWPQPKLKGRRRFSPETAPCWYVASDPVQPRDPPPPRPGHASTTRASPGSPVLTRYGKMCGVLSCSVVFDSLTLWYFLGKNTGVGCHFLLQGIFQTHGSNPGLLHLLHWQADDKAGKKIQWRKDSLFNK